MTHKVKCSEWKGQPALYAQLKYDGHYTRVVKDDVGVVTAWSSLPRQIVLPDRLLVNVHRFVPPSTTLLGELVAPSGRSSDAKTALNDGTCEVVWFAIEQYDGETDDELQFGLAGAPLEWVADRFTSWGLPFATYMTVDSTELERHKLLAWADDYGAEGVVLKDSNLFNWHKVKRVRTADLLCVGVTDGEGKFDELVGSLVCCCADGRIVAHVSGMTDEERLAFTLSPLSVVGHVVEVAYQYLGNGGRLRHPRFVKMRDDKGGRDVTPFEEL